MHRNLCDVVILLPVTGRIPGIVCRTAAIPAAIVQAVTNYQDAKLLAELSEDLGEAMVGINEQEIQLLMANRGI